jgi:hypothetical protein
VQSVDVANTRVTVSLDTAQTYTSGGAWARNAPFNTTGMVKRIYRTVGTSGLFLYVGEVAVATTTFNDTVAAADLGERLKQLVAINVSTIIMLRVRSIANATTNRSRSIIS